MIKNELEKQAQQITFEELIKDLQRVAYLLKKNTLNIDDYASLGKYAYYIVKIKFSNWNKALMTSNLKMNFKTLNISDELLIYDIKQAATILKKETINREEYKIFGKYSFKIIQKRFGSWIKALEKAGFIENPPRYATEEELITNLKEVYEKLKKTPTISDIKIPISKYGLKPYVRMFGTWNRAIEKAGYISNHYIYVSENDLINNLKALAIKLGRTPRIYDLKKPLSKYTIKVYVAKFGKWIRALEKAGYVENPPRYATEEDLIKNIKEVAIKLKRTPTLEEMKKPLSKYEEKTYYRIFGSWQQALKMAGLESKLYKKISEDELISNLQSITNKLGRLPHYKEIKKPISKYAKGTYINRFGSWSKAIVAMGLK